MIPLYKQRNITCEYAYTSTNNCIKITLLNLNEIVRVPILVLGILNSFDSSAIINSTLLITRNDNQVPKIDSAREITVERIGNEIFITDGASNNFNYADFMVITQPNIKLKVEAITK